MLKNMAVDNNLILAALAIGAIYLVVQSGEKDTDRAKLAVEDSFAQGNDVDMAEDESPSPQREASRDICAEDLRKAIKEYQFLRHYERNSEAELQQLHQLQHQQR